MAAAMDEASNDRSNDISNQASSTKLESVREGTPSSAGSSPEQDTAADAQQQQPSQPPKRKGGRKPIYATSEERKQRNRQAQAAFRERRTEYIKQLEATIKQNEESLSTLQQSHRTAADECLMLRYKNSLLERILLEKGIDVRTELQLKTGSPILGPPFAHPGAMSQMQQNQPQLQRTALQRQHARRSIGQPVSAKGADGNFPTSSPQGVPTPSSHASSPTNVSTRSPMALHSGGAMTPPMSAVLAQSQQPQFSNASRARLQHGNPNFFAQQNQPQATQSRQQPQRPGTSGLQTAQSANGGSFSIPHNPASVNSAQGGPAAYYPSPFQKHIDQLGESAIPLTAQHALTTAEQEYDTEHQTMLDHDPSQLQASYNNNNDMKPASSGDYYVPADNPQTSSSSSQFTQGHIIIPGQDQDAMQDAYDALGHIDPNDPMLDADPFGLSASMHYPTAFSIMNHSQAR